MFASVDQLGSKLGEELVEVLVVDAERPLANCSNSWTSGIVAPHRPTDFPDEAIIETRWLSPIVWRREGFLTPI
jgi:hypothetical protein